MDEVRWQAAGVVVSILAAIAAALFSQRAIAASRAQQHAQLFALERQHFSELRQWADEGIEILTAAIFLCDVDPKRLPEETLFHRWLPVKERLSAVLDKGRFFLPNEPVGAVGAHKPAAYRGWRAPQLDPLASAYDLLREFDLRDQHANRRIRDMLWQERQRFVSDVQGLLDPAGRLFQLQTLIGDSAGAFAIRL